MSASGPKRTFHYVAFDVAFGGKADMSLCAAHVRLRPKADISGHVSRLLDVFSMRGLYRCVGGALSRLRQDFPDIEVVQE